MVFALPAASAPPISVTAISSIDGRPRLASSIVGRVVTSSSSMMRGLVRANRDRAISPADRRRARVDPRSPAPAGTADASGSAFVACVTRHPPCSPAPGYQGPHAEYYRS